MACHLTVSARRAECKQHSRASVRARAQGTQPDVKAKIYLGKGRFIEDDPTLYPAKDEWGTGGWAGGEQGLLQFVAQAQLEEAVQKEQAQKVEPAPGSLGVGKDSIYVGKGQYIQDDARIYPSKEDAGPLTGSTGGFAGGERGLQHFIRTQSLEPAPPELISERHARSDAFAAIGTAVAAGACYIAYLFVTGQPLPQVPDASALTSATTQMSQTVSGMAAGSGSVGVPPVPGAVPAFSVPAVSDGQIKVAAAAGAVVSVVGGAVVFQRTKEVVAHAGQQVKEFAEANLVRLLVLGVAVAVYSALLK